MDNESLIRELADTCFEFGITHARLKFLSATREKTSQAVVYCNEEYDRLAARRESLLVESIRRFEAIDENDQKIRVALYEALDLLIR